MKKVLTFILLLLIPFLVNAEEEKFNLSFATKEQLFSFETVSYQKGYVVSDYDGTKGILAYYSIDGELLEEYPLENNRAGVNLYVIDDNLYVVTCDFATGNNVHILRYDEEFNLIKDLDFQINYYERAVYASYKSFLELINGDTFGLGDYYQNKIAMAYKDLESVTIVPYSIDYIAEHFSSIAMNNMNGIYYPSNIYGPSAIYDLGNSYYMGVRATKICEDTNIIYSYQTDIEGTLYEDCYQYSIDIRYSRELELLWSYDFDEKIETVYNAKAIDNYIVLTAYAKNDLYIFIFDMEGNLIQKMTSEEFVFDRDTVYSYINRIDNGFAITERCPTPNGIPDENCTSRHLVFLIKNEIETETEGKGNIIVPDRAIYGERVTINIEPEEGYVLGELKVIDEEGNEIPVENNTFIMGLSKVTIQATFVPVNPANPLTKDIAIIVILILAITSGILLLINHRKLRFIR